MSQRARLTLALILVALGLVWIGQGTGLLRGSSFMVGDPLWAWIGVAVAVAGAAVAWLALQRPSRG